MRFHPEVPLIPLLRLVHLRISSLVPVLRRRRRRNQRGIDNRSSMHQQAFGSQVPVDRIEDLAGQRVGFEQAAKLQQGRGIWSGFASQIEADEVANRLVVVERVFAPFIGQAETVRRNGWRGAE